MVLMIYYSKRFFGGHSQREDWKLIARGIINIVVCHINRELWNTVRASSCLLIFLAFVVRNWLKVKSRALFLEKHRSIFFLDLDQTLNEGNCWCENLCVPRVGKRWSRKEKVKKKKRKGRGGKKEEVKKLELSPESQSALNHLPRACSFLFHL